MDESTQTVQCMHNNFFQRYPRFFDTSVTDTRGRRMEYRYTALIDANRALIENMRVLDLASHDGRWSFAALDAGAVHVTGIEFRQALIDHAQANMAQYGVSANRYEFTQGDCIERLREVPRGSIDTVFCFGFLYHTLSHFELLQQLQRIGPRYLLLDTSLLDSDEAIIHLAVDDPRHEGAAVPTSDADEFALVGVPTRGALERMLVHLGYDVAYVDWHSLVDTDWDGVRDYENRRRFTLVATAREPAKARPALNACDSITPDNPVVLVNGKGISLRSLLLHACSTGDTNFIDALIEQKLIEIAAERVDIDVSDMEIARMKRQFLTAQCGEDPALQDQWLSESGLSEMELYEQLRSVLQFGKLKGMVATPLVETAFEQHKRSLVRLSLSRIVTMEREMADELLARIKASEDFAQLAKRHSIDEDTACGGGFMGRHTVSDLDPPLAMALQESAESDLVGPIAAGDAWAIYRVEKVWAPSLDLKTRTRLNHALFSEWLSRERAQADVSIPLLETS